MRGRALVRVLGRPIRCAECGNTLFRGFAIVWRGRVKLLGADRETVRVSFDASDALQFRHVHLEQCPTPERPWLSDS
jgi:hypothetical protein